MNDPPFKEILALLMLAAGVYYLAIVLEIRFIRLKIVTGVALGVSILFGIVAPNPTVLRIVFVLSAISSAFIIIKELVDRYRRERQKENLMIWTDEPGVDIDHLLGNGDIQDIIDDNIELRNNVYMATGNEKLTQKIENYQKKKEREKKVERFVRRASKPRGRWF